MNTLLFASSRRLVPVDGSLLAVAAAGAFGLWLALASLQHLHLF